MKRNRRSVKLLLAIGALFWVVGMVLNPGTAAAKTYVIKLAHGAEPTEPTHKGALYLAKKMEERTNGAVKVQVYPSEQLGSERDIIEATKVGAIQMFFSSPGSIGVFQPDVQIFNGPFVWKDWEEAKRIMRGPFGQKIYAKLEKEHGLIILDPTWYWGWRHLTTRNTPIRRPADTKGLKIRAPNIPIFVETIKAMGASPTPIDFSEVYTALQQGVVDGQENPIPTIWAKKFFEVQKYVMLTGHMLQSNSMAVNGKFFGSLPAEYRKILKEEALAAGEHATELQQGEENSLIAQIEKAGTQIIRDVDREAFRKATEGVYDLFKDKWTPGLYQDLRKAIEAE